MPPQFDKGNGLEVSLDNLGDVNIEGYAKAAEKVMGEVPPSDLTVIDPSPSTTRSSTDYLIHNTMDQYPTLKFDQLVYNCDSRGLSYLRSAY